MAEPTAAQRPTRGAKLRAGAPYHPRLGDLATDTAKGGTIGVVVATPSDTSPSYHLRTPGGGEEWSAPADGTTLRPVPVRTTHVTPTQSDALYDHRAQQTALMVILHREDGGTEQSVLILTPGQVELYRAQLDLIIEQRAQAIAQAPREPRW
ncbi:hypothetical protein [Streptomyces lavendulae]|uniref:hypothetical protein n=1 Tax=Streptomyces lavendulae TaxID=1914 RepID=UPI0031EF8F86